MPEESTGNEQMVEEALDVAREAVGKDFEIDYVDEGEDVEEPAGGASPEEAMGGEVAAKPDEEADAEPQGKPSQKIAAEKYRERAQKRLEQQQEQTRLQQELETSRQQQEELKGYLNVLLRRMAGRSNGQEPQESEEPQYPNVDPEVQGLLRHEIGRVKEGVEELVQPFLKDREQLAQQQEQMTRLQQQAAEHQALVQRLKAEEDEYRASELGEGYDERFTGFQESFRGLMGDLQEQFPHITDEVVQELEHMNLMGMVALSQRLGVPTPYFADAYMRSFGNGSAAAQAPRRPPSDELSAAQQAVADGVGTGRRGHGSPPSDDALDIDLIIDRGLTPEALAKLVDEGGDWASRVVGLTQEVEKRLD